jgi:hypothetical protein
MRCTQTRKVKSAENRGREEASDALYTNEAVMRKGQVYSKSNAMSNITIALDLE